MVKFKSVQEYEWEFIFVFKLKFICSFFGMYVGEYMVGMEFVIGLLFVVYGVSVVDLIWGLLLGNLLVVLSWVFFCVFIVVKEWIILYYKLEKICGKGLIIVYNFVNVLMFCFLVGFMIVVVVIVVGIFFDIFMLQFIDWMLGSVFWVIIVVAVGIVIILIVILGYEQVSCFVNIVVFWMILVFLVVVLVVLFELGVNGIGDFWLVVEIKIWMGVFLEGQLKFIFWYILFFVWFCNMAMYIGMVDMFIFRYVCSWKVGFILVVGMYVGYYIVWLVFGILYVVFLQ